MNPGILYGGFLVVAAALGLIVGGGFERWRWNDRLRDRGIDPHTLRPLGRFGTLDQIGESNARLEEAVEAIALEVERLAEGQRLVTQKLSDRTDLASPRRTVSRTPVPHAAGASVRPVSPPIQDSLPL